MMQNSNRQNPVGTAGVQTIEAGKSQGGRKSPKVIRGNDLRSGTGKNSGK